MRALAWALLMLPWVAFAAEQAPQLDIRSLDEMENVGEWKSLASDGVSASLHAAKGVDRNALVLEYNLNNTAGYAAATRKLPVTLPEDYEITFWMRGEAGRNHFEMKFVDASGDNVWWFRRPNFQVSGDWQQIRIKRRQVEFAWGPTSDRTLKSFAGIEFVVAAGQDGGQGSLWFDRLAIKPIQRASNVAKPTITASSQDEKNVAARAIDGQAKTAWQSDASGNDQTLQLDLQAVQEFGGLEIDWAPELYAQRYNDRTLSLDGKTWNKVRTIEAGNGGRDSHLLPESEARYIRLTMPKPGRAVGIAELYVRDLQFGASPNAFIESLAKNARKRLLSAGVFERANVLDHHRRRRRQRREHAVRGRRARSAQGQLLHRALHSGARQMADLGGHVDSPIARGELSADPDRGMETFRGDALDHGLRHR